MTPNIDDNHIDKNIHDSNNKKRSKTSNIKSR
jgi:hypothetical protein